MEEEETNNDPFVCLNVTNNKIQNIKNQIKKKSKENIDDNELTSKTFMKCYKKKTISGKRKKKLQK